VVGDGMIGCEKADFLAEQGKKVTVVEMLPAIGLTYANRSNRLANLEEKEHNPVQPFELQRYGMRGEDKTKEQLIGELDGMRQQIIELEKGKAERKQTEHNLNERVKELECLYNIASIVERPGITLNELYQEVTNLLPASWQYPEIACARIIINDKEFRTNNYAETQWKQASSINVHGIKTGVVEVNYLESRPEIDEGPFLKEERHLIDAVVERLGRITERTLAEEALAKAKDELEVRVKERTAELVKVNENLSQEMIERKRAHEALEAAHGFQQSIIDAVAEPIMVIGVDYRVKLMNRAAREFSSGLTDTLKPLFCYQISHQRETPCNGMKHPCPLEKVRESGQPVTVMHEHFGANGERRFIEVVAAPFPGTDDTFHGIVESVRDITERKQAERTLQQYTERLRALATQLAEVAETEQQQLAQELHDQVGQNLTALGINLNIIRTQMPKKASSSMLSHLNDSLLLVEQTAEQIRNIMSSLRPPVLDDYGLVSALRWYGEQFATRTAIAVTVEGEEPVPRLAVRVENTLFRIVQEALTNVAKHAQATQVTVTIEMHNGTLRMVVADDGVGFDPERLPTPGVNQGWGLIIMRERAEAVGGVFSIESRPGSGTRLIVEVAR